MSDYQKVLILIKYNLLFLNFYGYFLCHKGILLFRILFPIGYPIIYKAICYVFSLPFLFCLVPLSKIQLTLCYSISGLNSVTLIEFSGLYQYHTVFLLFIVNLESNGRSLPSVSLHFQDFHILWPLGFQVNCRKSFQFLFFFNVAY